MQQIVRQQIVRQQIVRQQIVVIVATNRSAANCSAAKIRHKKIRQQILIAKIKQQIVATKYKLLTAKFDHSKLSRKPKIQNTSAPKTPPEEERTNMVVRLSRASGLVVLNPLGERLKKKRPGGVFFLKFVFV